MNKVHTIYVCQQCGHQAHKWLGRCPSCDAWGSFIEQTTRPESATPRTGVAGHEAERLGDIDGQGLIRLSAGDAEFDRVLGGGAVPGSLVLVGGAPGAGKSTLLLQMAARLAGSGQSVLYVSGEESAQQIRLRSERLDLGDSQCHILDETDVDCILGELERLRPGIVVIDSVQAMKDASLEAIAGTISQVRQSSARLGEWAKDNQAVMFFIGHVTKSGDIAGPRALEHMVDTVLYFDTETTEVLRLLRATKNRYGSTDELAIFRMTGAGLVAVANPSADFLAERATEVPGSVVTCILQGSRPLLVEIQALVSPSYYGTPQRTVTSVHRPRVALLLAVMEKRLGMGLGEYDVFVNVAGGIRASEPACDLAIALAVASSFREQSVPADMVVIGEVGLAGEIRRPPRLPMRAQEAVRLGFGQIVSSGQLAGETAEGFDESVTKRLQYHRVSRLSEALEVAGL